MSILASNLGMTIFFPCYNDAGTIVELVIKAFNVLEQLSSDYEVIVVNDGSTDDSLERLMRLQKDYSFLKIVNHEKNKGYGSALRSGFKAATKDLIFYTDGDAQYDVMEFCLLYREWERTGADVVNGYKIKRHDPFYRIVIGKIYQYLMKFMFALKIRDVDCDFRLIKRSVFDTISLSSKTGVICVEMIYKIEQAGFKIKEIPVHHFARSYGKSQIINFRRILRIMKALISLWFRLVFLKLLLKKQGKLN